MGARGKKSADALSITPIRLAISRPAPPAVLTESEAEVWRDTVATMPTGWFNRAQHPLLIAYCRHTTRANQLARLVNDFEAEWIAEEGGLQRLDKLMAMAERETRALTACARSMRITHQAQILPRGAGRANDAPQGPRPWDDPMNRSIGA